MFTRPVKRPCRHNRTKNYVDQNCIIDQSMMPTGLYVCIFVMQCALSAMVVLYNVYFFTRFQIQDPVEDYGMVAIVDLASFTSLLWVLKDWLTERRSKITPEDGFDIQIPNGRLVNIQSSIAQCPICLEAIAGYAFVTPCGHNFHPQCVSECIQNNHKVCPLCRESIVRRV